MPGNHADSPGFVIVRGTSARGNIQMIEEFLERSWDMLVGRVTGPMHLRFFLQPSMATIFAVLADIRDARKGLPPYLWSVFWDSGDRKSLFQGWWKDVRKVFYVALLLDVVYQLIELRWVYPVQAIFVAAVLAIVPYAVIRGPITRLMYIILHRGTKAESTVIDESKMRQPGRAV